MAKSDRITPAFITSLKPNEIFVFGSNLMGQHMGGAARQAHSKFGAQWGIGAEPTGQCYAIPTMHGGLSAIRPYVDQFLQYAAANPHKRFLLTRVGCGIAGFKDREMASLFAGVLSLSNVTIPREWLPTIIFLNSGIN